MFLHAKFTHNFARSKKGRHETHAKGERVKKKFILSDRVAWLFINMQLLTWIWFYQTAVVIRILFTFCAPVERGTNGRWSHIYVPYYVRVMSVTWFTQGRTCISLGLQKQQIMLSYFSSLMHCFNHYRLSIAISCHYISLLCKITQNHFKSKVQALYWNWVAITCHVQGWTKVYSIVVSTYNILRKQKGQNYHS